MTGYHLVLQHPNIDGCDLSCLHALRPSEIESPFPDSVRRFAANPGDILAPKAAAALDAQQSTTPCCPRCRFPPSA